MSRLDSDTDFRKLPDDISNRTANDLNTTPQYSTVNVLLEEITSMSGYTGAHFHTAGRSLSLPSLLSKPFISLQYCAIVASVPVLTEPPLRFGCPSSQSKSKTDRPFRETGPVSLEQGLPRNNLAGSLSKCIPYTKYPTYSGHPTGPLLGRHREFPSSSGHPCPHHGYITFWFGPVGRPFRIRAFPILPVRLIGKTYWSGRPAAASSRA